MKHIITEQLINEFKKYLEYEEKSAATIEKYIRDIKKINGLCWWQGDYKKTYDRI